MSCRAIKLEEITVISHPKMPSVLVIESTESIEISRGSTTQRSCLKTNQSTNSRISRSVEP